VAIDSRSAAVAEQPTLLADAQPAWFAPGRAQEKV